MRAFLLSMALPLLSVNFTKPALCEIVLYAENYTTVASGRVKDYQAFLGLQVELGFVDKHNESVPFSRCDVSENLCRFIEERNGKFFLKIAQESYGLVNTTMQQQMQEQLMIRMGAVKAFRPFIDVEGKLVPIQNLLSTFAKRWAGRSSKKAGPNCFHAAIASINEGWEEARHMSKSEFLCHLERSFDEVLGLDTLGDTLVLFSRDNIPLHAATYVGATRGNQKILLTKNGKIEGFYLFMDLETIMENRFLYDNTSPKFFRLRKHARPSECRHSQR